MDGFFETPETEHPDELTKININNWFNDFKNKLERKTTRDDLDRLFLSVERMEADLLNEQMIIENIYFKDGKGKIYDKDMASVELSPFVDEFGSLKPGVFTITKFQETILKRSPKLQGKLIRRSDLTIETGNWKLHPDLKRNILSEGGEAIVLQETIANKEVAVRIQVFDPALFTKSFNGKIVHETYLSKDFDGAENDDYESDEDYIPFHDNVIKHFCNIEIYSANDKKDCLGWITVMEKCDFNLRERLKEEKLNIEERKNILKGVKKGNDYLEKIGIFHFDKKPENILLKNGEPKWSDFGIIMVTTDIRSFRKMGYARKGNKYQDKYYLNAGSAGFSTNMQITGRNGDDEDISRLHAFILCDWKTTWSLLYNPIEHKDLQIIKDELNTFNAEWLSNEFPEDEDLNKLSKIISIKNASSHCTLDDPRFTMSFAANYFRWQWTRTMNTNFFNLPKDILNQKDTNLCVPISVGVVIRWALENDLKDAHVEMNNFSIENIITTLNMIIYPRSLAGFNLNPRDKEKNYQENEIEFLLRRIKYRTYLNKSGWEIFESMQFGRTLATFDFEQVLLHESFTFSRPLTVTGAYLNCDRTIIFHQMLLDRVEYGEYILQNTLSRHSSSQIRIPLRRQYYARDEVIEECYIKHKGSFLYGPNGEFLTVLNEYQRAENSFPENEMKTETWYLFHQAYSIILKI